MRLYLCVFLCACGFFWVPAAAASTLDEVKARGRLNCGVARDLAGFSAVDRSGNWRGLGADFCRALAAAIFENGAAVDFVPLEEERRFAALKAREIDVLSGLTNWTMYNETALGVSFVGVIYYDAQGLMVHKKLEIQSALELSGAEICTGTGAMAELNIDDFFRSHGMPYKIVAFEKPDEALKAYEAGRCDAYSAEASALAELRRKLAAPEDSTVLPEPISKEPLSPIVRQQDHQWENLVRWILFALVDAEELGVTRANAKALAAADAMPSVKRLLGTEGDFGKALGVGRDWALLAIAAVGNYGEMFERNLGEESPLKIDRGLNKLWNKGGILYAPPIR